MKVLASLKQGTVAFKVLYSAQSEIQLSVTVLLHIGSLGLKTGVIQVILTPVFLIPVAWYACSWPKLCEGSTVYHLIGDC